MLTVCNAWSAPQSAGVSIQTRLGRSHLPRSFVLVEELSISSMPNLQGFKEQSDITLRGVPSRRLACASGAATKVARIQVAQSSTLLRAQANSTRLVRSNAPAASD